MSYEKQTDISQMLTVHLDQKAPVGAPLWSESAMFANDIK